ncbi:hypothetical protein EV649_5086 [Kribbella sp. VKM Ac-2569]|uniref:hypothetical protein n=1 Tax=Kribbella sp. VKM Ac-2569 TaxID=2512220 RepID=UPI00102AD0EE|nr:hypothetical protein [Kribbella sp. VKM Ac-2569]RZT17539.1 hypothetical protein EV649_5086 [Kribbella sp. VKM Ac-2569]
MARHHLPRVRSTGEQEACEAEHWVAPNSGDITRPTGEQRPADLDGVYPRRHAGAAALTNIVGAGPKLLAHVRQHRSHGDRQPRNVRELHKMPDIEQTATLGPQVVQRHHWAYRRLGPQQVLDFYASQAGAGELVTQNRFALAPISDVPEMGRADRSLPFELDEGSPNSAAILGKAFDRGVAGVTGDSEIRPFVATQREQVASDIPEGMRGRLSGRLLHCWESDACELLHVLADAVSKASLRVAARSILLGHTERRIRLNLVRANS